MRADERAKGPSERRVRHARSTESDHVQRTSHVDTHSFSIQPQEISVRRVLEILKPHEHLCFIYESPEEWRAVVIPFIAIGLKRNEKCVYVVDNSTAGEIRKYLAEEGIDVVSAEKTGQLSVLNQAEAYTREGSFDPDRMISLLISETEKAIAEGYQALRVTGEMTWVLRGCPGSEKVLEYEAKLNSDFFPRYPCLAICQYDRWQFDPEIIKSMVMTHPLLIRGNRVYHNFYYIPAKEYLSEQQAELEVQYWLKNLEREQMVQQSLRQSEERYRSALDNMMEGYQIISFDWRYLYLNDVAAGHGRRKKEELLGHTITDIFPGIEKTEMFTELRRCMEKRVSYRMENEFTFLDGSTQWFELSMVTVPEGIAILSWDISRRKKIEEELRGREEFLENVINYTPNAMWISDDKGTVIRMNQALRDLMKITDEQIIGNYNVLKDTQVIEQGLLPLVKSVFEKGKTVNFTIDYYTEKEKQLKLDKKEHKILEITMSAVKGKGGKVVNAICLHRDVTALKQAKAELQHAHEEWEHIFQAIGHPTLLLDADHTILNANLATVKATGKPVAELAGKKCWEIFHQAGQPRDCPYETMLISGDLATTEMTIEALGGSYLVSCTPMLDAHGKIEKVIHIATDISELKRAENALRESEDRYRSIFENSDDAVLLTSPPDGSILSANPAACRMFELTEAEIIQEGRRGVVDTTDPRMPAAMKERERTGRFRGELTFLRRGKQPFPGEITSVMFRGRNGQPRTSMIIRDITERERMEKALRESEEKYRTLFETMSQGVVYQDANGRIFSANPAAERILGLTFDQMQGRTSTDPNWKAICEDGSDFPGETHPAMVALRTGEEVRDVVMGVFHPDNNEYVWISINAVPLFMPGEARPSRVYTIFEDITGRKRARAKREQFEQKAQLASRLASVGEMAAGVAHEINNPLTGVIGYAQLLMARKDIPPDIRKDLEAINDSAQRVAGIIQRLLAFSRQTRPERKLIDINELVENTLVLRAYHLRVNNIEVVTHLSHESLLTMVDPGQIQQVLLNLIVNTEAEMKLAQGKGKLTITTEKNDEIIKIYIQDNGPGIRADIIDRIFDPFFTTREAGQGTGLGLSLCYGIVAEHNGRIYAESKLGEGATFIVELPVIAGARMAKPDDSVATKYGKRIKARILVVDDEKVVRDIASRVLTSEGHTIEAVDNALEALRRIESRNYDLVLMDIKMPGMSGTTLYKHIKKIDESLIRRVIFITGDIMGEDTKKFLARTRVAHLEKPFDAKQLLEAVDRVLNSE